MNNGEKHGKSFPFASHFIVLETSFNSRYLLNEKTVEKDYYENIN